ncbi:MAG TPA: hypothetical protein P5230_01865 [Candidatus Magasanikbacteria bacterium]|nr:hypothetical protein [Candidatus Magasanikbacteria bacterium]
MYAHRLSTKPAHEPPVKTYRVIAFSFLALTVVLLTIVIFSALKKTEITVIAKEDKKTINLAVSAAKEKAGEKSLSAIVTTTKFYFSENYSPTGAKTVEGLSKGEVTVYNKTNELVTLVKTTRLLSPNNVLFRLSDRINIPAQGKITAKVYADQGGASSDIGPTSFTIPGLSTEKQKSVYAESAQPMAGGSGKIGIVSESDISSAKNDFKEKVRQAYLKQIKETEIWADLKIVSISDSESVSSHKVGDEAGNFSLTGTSTVVAVFLAKKDLEELLNKEIGKTVDNNSEKILSFSGEPVISIASTDLTKQSAELNVSQETLVTLNVDAQSLAKTNFAGKDKSEIERYVVSLPHVTGVNVKFSPSWSDTAPSSPDKIKVVVKNVK